MGYGCGGSGSDPSEEAPLYCFGTQPPPAGDVMGEIQDGGSELDSDTDQNLDSGGGSEGPSDTSAELDAEIQKDDADKDGQDG